MAIGTDPFDATELIAYINEIWTPITMEEFFAKAVAANFFMDLSPFASQGGDIFHIPNVFTNAFSVQTQSTQATEVTTDAPATTDTTLTINNHVYIATLLGYMDQVQIASVYDINEIYARKAGGTLVEDLEGDLFALQSSVSTNTVGSTAAVVADSELRQAMEKLDTADVPLNESAWFFHPYTYWNQIHAVQKYYDASQAGWNTPSTSLTPSGNFGQGDFARSLRGMLFGVPVFTSSKVVNTLLAVRNLLAHRTAFAFATQTPGGSRIRFQSANWLENLGILAVWDMINGTTATREETAVLINGSNAFIGS